MNIKPRLNADGITIHTPDEFEGMRKSGALAAKILDMITEYVVPGVTTEALDKLIHDYMINAGAIPATLGYRGYTKSCCISLNPVSYTHLTLPTICSV